MEGKVYQLIDGRLVSWQKNAKGGAGVYDIVFD